MIQIVKSRDDLFDELGLKRLRESYMRDDEESPQERYKYVSEAFSSDTEHAQRLYDYSSKHWLSYSTPVLSYGKTKNGLPISCYLGWLEDSKEGLVDTLSETNWLSMLGGGIGIGVGIRSADDLSVGIMPHLKIYEASSHAYRQGKSRRGSYATYLDIDHPDILMFIEMRKATGEPRIRTPDLHHGVNVSDKFMRLIERCMSEPNVDDTWILRDPNGKEKGSVSAMDIWQRLLETRMLTGEPYLHFIDTANHALPQWLKDKGLKIRQSNLCSEIELPTDKYRTAVCCLSSLNLDYYDEWKDDDQFHYDVLMMLDNVLSVFIKNAPGVINRAKYSAMRERSVGIGTLGFHSLLQSKGIAFESLEAIDLNNRIFHGINMRLRAANLRLGSERGEAPDAEGTGLRLSHTMAIAPNASTSIIHGNTSPSIEAFAANAYRQDTMSGANITKNKHLQKLLLEKYSNLNNEEIWQSIVSNNGSVQHLSFLTEHERNIFKTADEIDQKWVILLASNRQRFIDQGQSVNLFFKPNVNIKYLSDVHFMAWKSGMKALYYCRSEKLRKADNISAQVERNIIEEMIDISVNDEICIACEG